jgi:hypothetical protein
MPRSKQDAMLLLGFCLCLPVSAILAFFLAGAIAFPIVEPYYATRVFASLGLMALVYGAECVLNWGTIETCGLLSGHCTTHDLHSYAIQIWQVLAVLSLALLIGLSLLLRRQGSKHSE